MANSWHLRLARRSRQFLVESLLDDLQLEALYDPLLKNLRGEKAPRFGFLQEESDWAVSPPHKNPGAAFIGSQLKRCQWLSDIDFASPILQNSPPPLAHASS